MNNIRKETFEATSLIATGISDTGLEDRLSKYYAKIFKRLPFNTQRAYISDMNDFSAWCQYYSPIKLSGNTETNEMIIENYFDSLMESELALSTIERRLATLSVFLEVCLWPNPMKSSRLLKEHIRLGKHSKPAKQHQAPPLQSDFITLLNDTIIPENNLDIRDRLVVNIMYDCLLRGSEICGVQVTDVNKKNNTLFLKNSKRDQRGEGSYRYLSDTSLGLIDEWRHEFDIQSGSLIRALSPKKTIQAKGVNYMSIYHTFKRITEKLNLESELSTHSTRVGAAVDMAEKNIDILSIQRAGGWGSLSMPAKYTEQVQASKAGMGQLANKIGR
jgi:site-specific recombinase XerD